MRKNRGPSEDGKLIRMLRQVGPSVLVAIPPQVQKACSLKAGDYVRFYYAKDGRVFLRKVTIK